MQILPADDAFAAGSGTFGSFVCLYLGCRPTSSTISGLWNPSGVAFVARPIHGAYQTTNLYGIHDYNAAFHSTADTTRSPSGVLFRKPFGTEVIVSATFEMRALAGGAPGLADLAPRGVMARASGGTLVSDGTADVHYRDIDCYFAAVYQKNSDNTLRLGIVRCVAGSVALVGAESGIISPPDLKKLATVTLSVSGTGATVTLIASVTGFGVTTSTSITRLDTAGTRIVAAGRCGYFSGSDRIVSGRTSVDLCHLLSVDDASVRVLQDEFRRLSLGACKQSSTDGAGTVGSGYLNSAFYWDAATYDGSAVVSGKTYTGSKRLRRNATAGRCDFDHQVTDDDANAGRLILSQRPADNRFSQHRSVKVIIPTAPAVATGEVWAGIALRAAQAQPVDEVAPTVAITSAPNFSGNGTAGTAGTGYLFVCRGRTSATVTWQLHRVVNNAHFPIANLAEFVIFPGYGTQFTMDLEVYPRNEFDPFGPVSLVCKVNGSLLAMALSTSAALPGSGFSNPSAGLFVDASSSRIKSNVGEGLITANGLLRSGTTSADIDPVFESWIQGSLTNASTLDQDQPSIAVAPEPAATGTALDAIIGPDFPFEVEYQSFEVSNPFSSGHRQTMPRYVFAATGLLMRRSVYKFRKAGVSATDLAALLAHWNAHDGTALAFNFTASGDSAVKVHYTTPIKYEVPSMESAGRYEVEFGLEELK